MHSGLSNKAIAQELGVCDHTTGIWRKRFKVERFFGIITDEQISCSSFNSLKLLRERIYKFIETYNQDPQPFKLTADAALILWNVEKNR
jgi:hypothetical protein